MHSTRPLLLGLGLLLRSTLTAQCPAGNVMITSQGDVAAFGINYPNCDTLPGDLAITGTFINDLSAFTGVEVILGDLRLEQVLGGPQDFSGFAQLTYIGGDLLVNNTVPLQDLQGLNALQRISGDLHIHDCDSLEDLAGLGALSVVGGDFIVGNSHMTSIQGIDQLDTIHGDFILGDGTTPTPATLPLITIPPDLDHVGGDMRISTGYTGTINGASGLEHIGGELLFASCYSTQSIQGFNAIDAVGTDLRFWGNQSLTLIMGFLELDSVPGEFQLFGNYALGSLGGFPQLDFCSEMTIEGNTALTSVTGFADLDSIGFLRFTQNPLLSDINAFDQTIPLGDLQINDNAQLAYCHVQAVCDRIALFMSGPYVLNNAVGCMDEAEVNANCITTGTSDRAGTIWSLQPNPTSGVLVLSTPITSSALVLDRSGRTVLRTQVTSGLLDVHRIDPGLYVLQVVHNGQLHRVPFVRE